MRGLADANSQARSPISARRAAGLAADFAKLIADETMKWGKVIELPISSPSDPGLVFHKSRSSEINAAGVREGPHPT